MEYIFAMAPQGGESGGMMSTLIMFAAIFAIFYFMIIRPQQKRAKEREEMLKNVEKNDQIITNGGIYGKVIQVDEKTILVDIGENTKVKFDKNAVASIISSKTE